jgi:hypothetical protein
VPASKTRIFIAAAADLVAKRAADLVRKACSKGTGQQ